MMYIIFLVVWILSARRFDCSSNVSVIASIVFYSIGAVTYFINTEIAEVLMRLSLIIGLYGVISLSFFCRFRDQEAPHR